MKKSLSIITITLIHLLSFGQQKKLDRSQTISEKLVGSWRLDYALYSGSSMGATFKDKSKIFHTDTIHFFKDQTFKFRTHDAENTDVTTHTGNWEITDNGKILVHKNRQAQPTFDGPSPDLFFPLKIINANRISIDYKIYFNDNNSEPKNNNTPVFFVRVK